MGNVLHTLMFPAPASTYTFDNVPTLRVVEGVPCLWNPARSPRGVIVYLHANGVDLGMIQGVVHALGRATQMSVVAPEYPGYGVSPGPVSTYGAVTAGTRVYNYFARRKVPGQKLILVGRSIGTGVAMQVASSRNLVLPPDGVALISPFSSIERLGATMFGPLGREITKNVYDNVAAARVVRAPTLIMTGLHDTLTPIQDGRDIANASVAEYKRFLVMPTSDHYVLDWTGIHGEINKLIQAPPAISPATPPATPPETPFAT